MFPVAMDPAGKWRKADRYAQLLELVGERTRLAEVISTLDTDVVEALPVSTIDRIIGDEVGAVWDLVRAEFEILVTVEEVRIEVADFASSLGQRVRRRTMSAEDVPVRTSGGYELLRDFPELTTTRMSSSSHPRLEVSSNVRQRLGEPFATALLESTPNHSALDGLRPYDLTTLQHAFGQMVTHMLVVGLLTSESATTDNASVGSLERAEEFPDELAVTTARAAAESLLNLLRSYVEDDSLPPDDWVLLDTSLSTIEAQLRHPAGNPTILTAAVADAVRAVQDHIELPEDVRLSDPAREVFDAARGLGVVDPLTAGDDARALLEAAADPGLLEAVTQGAAGPPGWLDEARAQARQGSLDGVRELANRAVTGSPAAAARVVDALVAWAFIAPQFGQWAGVAWVLVRIALAGFRRRS